MLKAGGVDLRAAAAAIGVGTLLVVVALTAGSVLDSPGTGRLVEVSREEVAGVMRRVLFLVYVAVLLHSMYLLMTREDRPRRTANGRRRATPHLFFLAVIAALGLLLLVVYLREGGVFPVEPAATSFTTAPAGAGGGRPTGSVAASPPTAPDWGVLVAGLGALAWVALLVILSGRRKQPGGRSAPAPLQPVARPVPRSVPTDPRHRIFAAYQAVATAADRSDLGRGSGETVTAHLRRLPPTPGAAAPRLASLYNRARFSPHPVRSADAETAERARREIEETMP